MVQSFLIAWALIVTLTLKIAGLSFRMTLWPMMTRNHTKFRCWCTLKLSLNTKGSAVQRMEQSYFDYMNLHCDLHLEDSKPIFFAEHSGSWWCFTKSSLVTKGFAVQKTSSKQRFIDILYLHSVLDLEPSNKIVSQDTSTYDVLSN